MIYLLRLAIFASGKGSNLRAIYNAIRSGELKGAELALVLSNNSTAEALAFAREHEIEALHLSPLTTGAEQYEAELLQAMNDRSIDLIALAGYMRKIPDSLIEAYKGRIVNIHPALLPEFGGSGMYGSYVHEAVLKAGKNKTGASVHFVEGEYDSGRIILQAECSVEPDDTPQSLGKRVLQCEHELYPKALQIVINTILSSK
ncbi:MAG TPA: phosphoribosylglycinamide formyltransferase [Candidatus Kapabacteria bacterium]|nr:phosphoribosylglycinamide formyltransferase [Candidatus Kapabacteria bacterium]